MGTPDSGYNYAFGPDSPLVRKLSVSIGLSGSAIKGQKRVEP